MTFDEYQKKSRETAVYPNLGKNIVYPTLGLAGESGEVAEKVKKIIRDNGGVVNDERKTLLEGELGDVLWYVAQIASELNTSLDAIASKNIEKLFSRKERGKISGDGDTR